jgi:hypothetical protein
MDNLPRDLKIKITSLLDMDARRKLGIFFKLRPPKDLQYLLENMHSKLVVNDKVSVVRLGESRPVFRGNEDDLENMYTLTRYFNTQHTTTVNYTVCHVSHSTTHDIIKMKIYYVSSFDKN